MTLAILSETTPLLPEKAVDSTPSLINETCLICLEALGDNPILCKQGHGSHADCLREQYAVIQRPLKCSVCPQMIPEKSYALTEAERADLKTAYTQEGTEAGGRTNAVLTRQYHEELMPAPNGEVASPLVEKLQFLGKIGTILLSLVGLALVMWTTGLAASVGIGLIVVGFSLGFLVLFSQLWYLIP